MKVLLVVALALSTSACGLMFGGTHQNIPIQSTPPGLAFTTTPATVAQTTPTTLSLERRTPYVLSFSMPGYTSQQVELQRRVRGGIVFLDILAFPIGVIVDAVTGAWYELRPGIVNVSLTKTALHLDGPETVAVTVTTFNETPAVRIESSVPGVTIETTAR